MDISAIALQGLDQAQAQLETAASGLDNLAASPNGVPTDTVALSEEAVALMSAKIDFAANLSVLHTANQIDKHLADLMA
jgi:hypothetical protein